MKDDKIITVCTPITWPRAEETLQTLDRLLTYWQQLEYVSKYRYDP